MSLPELIARFVRPLTQLDVLYLVMEGVAAITYSEPRYTHDLDLVMRLDADQAADFAAAFPRLEFYVPPVEVIEAESRRAAPSMSRSRLPRLKNMVRSKSARFTARVPRGARVAG